MEQKKPEPLTKDKIHDINADVFIGADMVGLDDLKSACEFYLKYEGNSSLFLKDFPVEWKNFFSNNDNPILDNYKSFNIWLFKFAFKGVLE